MTAGGYGLVQGHWVRDDHEGRGQKDDQKEYGPPGASVGAGSGGAPTARLVGRVVELLEEAAIRRERGASEHRAAVAVATFTLLEEISGRLSKVEEALSQGGREQPTSLGPNLGAQGGANSEEPVTAWKCEYRAASNRMAQMPSVPSWVARWQAVAATEGPNHDKGTTEDKKKQEGSPDTEPRGDGAGATGACYEQGKINFKEEQQGAAEPSIESGEEGAVAADATDERYRGEENELVESTVTGGDRCAAAQDQACGHVRSNEGTAPAQGLDRA